MHGGAGAAAVRRVAATPTNGATTEQTMKTLAAAALALTTTGTGAQTFTQHYPGCDLKAQHALKGDMGGTVTDPAQAHLSMRANILEADIDNARKARRLTEAQAGALTRRIGMVRDGADGLAARHRAIGAGERAMLDRRLDAIAAQVCRR